MKGITFTIGRNRPNKPPSNNIWLRQRRPMTSIVSRIPESCQNPKYHGPSLHHRRTIIFVHHVQICLATTWFTWVDSLHYHTSSLRWSPIPTKRLVWKHLDRVRGENNYHQHRSHRCPIGLQYHLQPKLHVHHVVCSFLSLSYHALPSQRDNFHHRSIDPPWTQPIRTHW
jgi:hypothetical protein